MEGNKYPLATLMILFYNQEKFVKDAVEGALSQTYPNLEIILSDDNSPDRTFEVIQECVKNYQGPHKIVLNKNENNMGLVPHINKLCFEVAKGEYIFLNGGDDISLPNRVDSGVEAFIKHPEVAAVTFSRIVINTDGAKTGTVEVQQEYKAIIDKDYLRKSDFMAGASALSFRKSVLDVFGRLSPDCQTEDSVLRFRALLLGGILCLPEFGLKYRVHDNNISRYYNNFKTKLIADQYMADIEKYKAKLSPHLYSMLQNKVEYYCHYRACLVARENCKSYFEKFVIDVKKKILKVIHNYKISQMHEKHSYCK